jgi:cephalosporin hydroxylase
MTKEAIKQAHDGWIMDKEILGEHLQPKDAGVDYLQAKDTYAWYAAIASFYKPKSIAEIGCRFGYSLKAMIAGAVHFHEPKDLVIQAIDNESYEPGCLDVVVSMLTDLQVGLFSIVEIDTQKQELGLEWKVDMFHVDGDHSIQGAYADLLAAKENLTETGVILVDDIDTAVCPGVAAAAALFLREFSEFKYDYYPTFRGLVVLHRDKA